MWIPVIQGGRGLYDYLQGVQGYLAPPIFVVFFLGVFNKRMNARGCLWALTVGFALGLFRLIVDTPVALKLSGFEQGYDPGSFFWIINNTYFQYYSAFITITCVIIMTAVSYSSAPPLESRIQNLTFGTITEDHRRESRASWTKWDVINSSIVLGLILIAYLYFTG
jgi:SSS family solute:Na+ symporter